MPEGFFFVSAALGGAGPLEKAFALGAFTGQFPGAAHGFGSFAGALLGRFFVVVPGLHFPEKAFALHLLLKGAQGLLDIIVADDDLYDLTLSCFVSTKCRRRSLNCRI